MFLIQDGKKGKGHRLVEIFRREFFGNFYSWRGGVWLLSASAIFSIVAYLLLTDKELSLLAQGEGLFLLGEVILSLGLILSAASASSTISREMESGTLECVLVTPRSSRQIAFEKLLSVVTLWVMLYVVSIPYLIVLASGTDLAWSAVFYVGLYGTLLVLAVSSLCIAISVRVNSSSSSIMGALMIVLLLLAPSVFFATSLRKTDFGVALENINPVSHAINSLDSVVVDNEQALVQQATHLIPIIFFVLLCALLFLWYTRRFEMKSPE
jgi:ABC-2 type transport system permease protein